MAVACALCMNPIGRNGGTWSQYGSMHHRCLAIFNKYRSSLDDARAKIDRIERARAADRADAANVRVQNMELESRVQILESRLKSTEADRDSLRQRVDREVAANRVDREMAANATRRVAALVAENDRLRNELNVVTVGGAPKGDGKAPDAKVAEDGRDPAVIRAELLELD